MKKIKGTKYVEVHIRCLVPYGGDFRPDNLEVLMKRFFQGEDVTIMANGVIRESKTPFRKREVKAISVACI